MLVIFLSLVIVVAIAVLIKNIAMLKSESKKSAVEKNKSSRSAPTFNKKAFLLKLKKFAVVGAIIIVPFLLLYITYLSFKFWFGHKGPMKFALALTKSFLLLIVGLICGLISKAAGKIIHKHRLKDLGNEILEHNGKESLLNITESVAGNDVPNLRNKYLQSEKPAPELLGELQLAYFKQLDLKDVEAVYRTAGELRLSYYAADLIAETYDGKLDPCIAQITWANAFYKYESDGQ